MKNVLIPALVVAFIATWFAQGQVSQSELGEPGTPAPRQSQSSPSFPAPTIEPPPKPAEPQAVQEMPAATPEPRDRNRAQSGKPVAAFWTVIPGR